MRQRFVVAGERECGDLVKSLVNGKRYHGATNSWLQKASLMVFLPLGFGAVKQNLSF